MNFLVTFLIFIIILFLYIHIHDQYKKSEDLEIYEMDYISNAELQKICNVKQPTIFEFKKIVPEFFYNFENREHSTSFVKKCENIDIKMKDVLDYWNPELKSIDPAILPFRSFQTLIKSDPKSHFFMEDNPDFLEETELLDEIRELDSFYKPTFNCHSKYDILMGSPNCVTPIRYHTDYRKFFTVVSGKITIKMTPWKSSKYLHPILDYDNYEFFSKINVWSPPKEYLNETDKIKFLEFEIVSGYVLYIPPYWWYSIKFYSETQIVSTSYQTIMNICSNIPDIFRYCMQFHNTKRKIARTLDIPNEIHISNDTTNSNNDSTNDSNNII
jgi:hypothetical protein